MSAWMPLYKTKIIPKNKKEIQKIAKEIGYTYKEMKDAFKREDIAEAWENDKYLVLVYRQDTITWLSMRTQDRSPFTNWRDKQRIKNQLVGPECEGIELYPAESRLVDTSNQFHLWVINDPTYRFPFGFNKRRVTEKVSGGAVQRPFD